MAKTTIITLIDDLDGGKAEETVSFGWAGSSYEIDLSAKNAKKLTDLLAPYVAAGRKTSSKSAGSRARSGGTGSARRDAEQSKAIRAWARSNGWPDLGDRGRIPDEVETAYNQAH